MSRPAEPVLVVEDDVDTRLALVQILTISGYLVATAGDGAQALDYLVRSGGSACLVLLDLHMPGMDGFAFLRAKDGLPELRDIPVVVYSAVDAAGLPRDVSYVRKGSSSPDHLLEVVARECRRAASTPA